MVRGRQPALLQRACNEQSLKGLQCRPREGAVNQPPCHLSPFPLLLLGVLV